MILPAPFRLSRTFLCIAATIAAVAAISFTYGRRSSNNGPIGATLAETLYVEAKAKTDTVRETVRQLVGRHRVDTLWRDDTITIRDTVRVLVPQPSLFRMDSTIRACALLDTLIGKERSACDRKHRLLVDSIARLQPKRLGCVLGYGGTVTLDGRASHGPSLTCGLRVRP